MYSFKKEIKRNGGVEIMYNIKEKYFFGCDNAIENIMTQRQINIFIKQLKNVIKK